ncbi:MAG: pyridoxal phosphate-dependent aminotransferase [Pseudomonadales bacterium]
MIRPFAHRMKDIEPFRVVEVLGRAQQLEAQGRSICHMEAGEPDFETAAPIREAGIRALQAGYTGYSAAAGIPALREAIANYYLTDYGLKIAPERIMVTAGASGALLLAAALLVNPGDGMLMTDPGYPCNRHFLRLVEGEGQLVPVTAEDRFQLTAALAKAHWRENTMGVMVASPANPTGEILTSEELAALFEFVESQSGCMVVDEIYHGLDYDKRSPSILSLTDQAFVISSFSKYFGMTGWRLGWLVAPLDAVPELEKLAQNLFISLSTPAQHAALACFEPTTRGILDGRREIFQQRRDFLLPELRKLGFEIPHSPAGGFYLYANASRHTRDSQKFCIDLLEQHGVALTPGLDFGRYRANEYVRFAFTTGIEKLEQAVERLQFLIE